MSKQPPVTEISNNCVVRDVTREIDLRPVETGRLYLNNTEPDECRRD